MGSDRAKLLTRCCYAAVTLITLSAMFWIAWCVFGLTSAQVSEAQRRAIVHYSPASRVSTTSPAAEETSVNAISRSPTAQPKDANRTASPTPPLPPTETGKEAEKEVPQEERIHARRVSAAAAPENRPEENATPTPRRDISPTRVLDEGARRESRVPADLPRRDEVQSSRRSEPDKTPEFEREQRPRAPEGGAKKREDDDDERYRYRDERPPVRDDRYKDDERNRPTTESRYEDEDRYRYRDDDRYRPREDDRYRDRTEDRDKPRDDDKYRDRPRDDDKYKDRTEDRYRPRDDDRYRPRDDDRYRPRDDDRYRDGTDDRYRPRDDDRYRDRTDERYRPRDDDRYRDGTDDRYRSKDDDRYRPRDDDKYRDGTDVRYRPRDDDRYRDRTDDRYSVRDDDKYRIRDEEKYRPREDDTYRPREDRYRPRGDEEYRSRDEERYNTRDGGRYRYRDDERYRTPEDDKRRLADDEEYRARTDERYRLKSDEPKVEPSRRYDDRTGVRRTDDGYAALSSPATRPRVESTTRGAEIRPTSSRYEQGLRSEETVTDYDVPVRPRYRERGRDEDDYVRPSRVEVPPSDDDAYSRRYSGGKDRYRTGDRREEVVLDRRSYAAEDDGPGRRDDDVRRRTPEGDRRQDDDYRTRSDERPIRRQDDDYRTRSDERPIRRYDDDELPRRKEPVPRPASSRDLGTSSSTRYEDSRDEYETPVRRRYDEDPEPRRRPGGGSRREPEDVTVRERLFEDVMQSRPRGSGRPLSARDVLEAASRQSDAPGPGTREVAYPVFDPRLSNLTSADLIRPSERRGTTLTSRRRRGA